MAEIFISYIQEDGDVARVIADGLEGAGYIVWYYERDSLPGRSYLEQVQEVIDHADAVVVIVSSAALGSSQVNIEISEAHVAGKPFAPLLRDLTYATFYSRQRSWAMMFGTAVAAPLPQDDPGAIVPRLVRGLHSLGVKPPGAVDEETPRPRRLPRRPPPVVEPDWPPAPSPQPRWPAAPPPVVSQHTGGKAPLILGYIFSVASVILLFAPIAIGFGIYNLRHGRRRHGWAQIILAVVLFFVGVSAFS